MNNTEKPTPRTEHASDIWPGDALDEQYRKTTALVGRVECEAHFAGMPPREQPSGELAVGLDRIHAPTRVFLAVRDSWHGFDHRHLAHHAGVAGLDPATARVLARYLNESADRADGGAMTMDDWREGGDVGESSLALYRALRLGRKLSGLTPADPADLGRCIRMLDLADSIGLAWRARLPLLQAADHWRPLIAAWPELEALYLEESSHDHGKRVHERLRELNRGL